ncbi:hypothetical protein SERLADRAFT_479030 [Serpula lacrymans var. lacrymans S7.9]|uniref:Uncharacterized protein n=1 Tax=Serpula lacrymans var. lacrymans (strain S7.9) TaxID=578457 RepID=F8PB72_SERL9|nr:uncharacterized protein SERLADRAFT_479030 [Serpula lacrymans var. lacrymans S7.9]EGO19512.1 hypothetical protein SERLADRAFT_479030 [Serpula lacrymans var. lacrymans S7.9]
MAGIDQSVASRFAMCVRCVQKPDSSCSRLGLDRGVHSLSPASSGPRGIHSWQRDCSDNVMKWKPTVISVSLLSPRSSITEGETTAVTMYSTAN